jgi:hypothetical protein
VLFRELSDVPHPETMSSNSAAHATRGGLLITWPSDLVPDFRRPSTGMLLATPAVRVDRAEQTSSSRRFTRVVIRSKSTRMVITHVVRWLTSSQTALWARYSPVHDNLRANTRDRLRAQPKPTEPRQKRSCATASLFDRRPLLGRDPGHCLVRRRSVYVEPGGRRTEYLARQPQGRRCWPWPTCSTDCSSCRPRSEASVGPEGHAPCRACC